MDERKESNDVETISIEYREKQSDSDPMPQSTSSEGDLNDSFLGGGSNAAEGNKSHVFGEASKRFMSSLKITQEKMGEHMKRGSDQLQDLGTNLKAQSKRVKGNIKVAQEQADKRAATLLSEVSFKKKAEDLSTDKKPRTPLTIFSSDYCKAHSLTISDQHATILLSHSPAKDSIDVDQSMVVPSAPTTVKSLLKLKIVPFHKSILGSNPVLKPDDTMHPERNNHEHDPCASETIISFLKQYNYDLTSESGAEYSFYEASPKANRFVLDPKRLIDDAVKTAMSVKAVINKKDDEVKVNAAETKVQVPGSFHVELISPATERQIQRAMPSPGSSMIQETPKMYKEVTKPFIQQIVDGSSLDWIKNVIEGKKEKERLLLNEDTYIMNIDTKWRSHPDPLSVPRAEWKNHEATKDLYCLGITKCPGIATIRDLTSEHIPMLQSMVKDGCKAIEETYGVKSDQIRVFAHYQPQFYWFHIHFTRLDNEFGAQVERGHLVLDIIQNLQSDPEYYDKRTISYKLQVTNPLYQQLQASATK